MGSELKSHVVTPALMPQDRGGKGSHLAQGHREEAGEKRGPGWGSAWGRGG